MSIYKTIVDYKNEIYKNGRSGLSMQLRLFIFLLLFVLSIMFGVLIILLLTGVLNAGQNETKALLESELTYISDDLYRDFGNISVQSVELSKALSSSIENKMKELNINARNFQDYPHHLEKLLDGELERLTGALEKTKSSGVFLLLDATVNPAIENSEYSRSGLYIKNMEPNIVNGTTSNLRFMRGPMSLALKNNIYILPQWKMEFNTKDTPIFTNLLKNEKNYELPLSRLYYWTDSINLINSNEDILLCIVPLISSDKRVFGLCGFEVSSMLFKLSYSPDNSKLNYLFCMLSKYNNNEIDFDGSLLAGSYCSYPSNLKNTRYYIEPNQDFINTYKQNVDGVKYVGLHKLISLYPEDSAYNNDQRIFSILMPENELSSIMYKQNTIIILCLSLLMIISIIACSFISRKYMKPVVEALDLLKTVSPSNVPKTKIIEIDDLIEFLAAQDEMSILSIDEKPSYDKNITDNNSTLFSEFIKNIDTLSMAEKAVFNLYLKGHTAKEIADILCLSINTIKTHNKRIYMKLNVSSRKELMVYVKMMEESNMI